jgi:biopolymer transport protein ExbD
LLPDGSNFKTTNFKEMRDVILTKKKSTDPKDFVVVIKAHAEATYKNAVDALDEMTINDVKRYALVDIAPVENQLIAATNQ